MRHIDGITGQFHQLLRYAFVCYRFLLKFQTACISWWVNWKDLEGQSPDYVKQIRCTERVNGL